MYLRKILFFVFLIISAHIYSDTDLYFYRIQVGPYQNDSEASVEKERLHALGYSPLVIQSANSKSFINIGDMNYYMDAFMVQEDLIKDGYNNSVILKDEKRTQTKNNAAIRSSNKARVFEVIEKDDKLTSCSYNLSDNDVVEISGAIAATKQKAALKTSKSVLELIEEKSAARKNSDPVKGWMKWRAAYLNLADKNTSEGLRLFKEVAEGKVMATPLQRCDAMWRYSHILHSKKERVKAYRAYNELYKYATNEKLKAQAVEEITGLMFELAMSDKGTLSETREFIKAKLLEMTTGSPYSIQLLELMNVETWYHEKNFAKCAELGSAFIEKYSKHEKNTLKLLASGCIFTGVAYTEIGEYDKAEAILKSVLDMPLKPTDRWQSTESLKNDAQNWLDHVKNKKIQSFTSDEPLKSTSSETAY